MERVILHSDMNNFYASVECMLNPELKAYPIAVCGDVEERHGIVLAKNYKAKAKGVSTGEAIWQQRFCIPVKQWLLINAISRRIKESVGFFLLGLDCLDIIIRDVSRACLHYAGGCPQGKLAIWPELCDGQIGCRWFGAISALATFFVFACEMPVFSGQEKLAIWPEFATDK